MVADIFLCSVAVKGKSFQFFLLMSPPKSPLWALPTDISSLGGSILVWLHATASVSGFIPQDPHSPTPTLHWKHSLWLPRAFRMKHQLLSLVHRKPFTGPGPACCSCLTLPLSSPPAPSPNSQFLCSVHSHRCDLLLLDNTASILGLPTSPHALPSALGAFPYFFTWLTLLYPKLKPSPCVIKNLPWPPPVWVRCPPCVSYSSLLFPEMVLVSILVFFFFFFLFFFSFSFWLCWVFVAACGLSLVAVSGGYSSLWCTGFSLQWLLLLQSTGSRRMGFSSCGTRAQ